MQKITLVTGASRGIGRATAINLATKGHYVIIGYHINGTKAQAVVDLIKQTGGQASAIQVNVADEDQVIALYKRIDDEVGKLTGLVNNAGILLTQTTIEHLDAQRINHMLSVNVTGAFLCAREAVKRMALRHGGQGGAIVNVSSTASRLGAPFTYIDYAASKGAIDTLTTGLALEVAAQGIRVNAVRPGFIYTEIHADGGEPDRVDRLKATLPMLRGGEPSEVADAIAWLLSDETTYVTGNFIDVSGGK